MSEGTELLSGAGGEDLLYVPTRGVYLRLSPSAADVVRRLLDHQGMTRAQLLAVLEGHRASSLADPLPMIEFFQQLCRSGAIVSCGERAPGSRPERRFVWRPATRLPLRLRVIRPNRPIGESIFARFRRTRTGRAGFSRVLVILMASAALANLTWGPPVSWSGVWWSALLPALLLHASLHECSHALAASYYGVKIRDAGVALLYWFIPVLYVDRTDSYRLQRASPRGWIALAGPAFDGSAAACTALLAWSATGRLQATLAALSTLQSLLLVSNLNPLMPSDGYHAIEAFTGQLNVRKRALLVLLHALRLRPLPAHLRLQTRTERRLYAVFGVLSFCYLSVVAAVAAFALPHIVHLLMERLS